MSIWIRSCFSHLGHSSNLGCLNHLGHLSNLGNLSHFGHLGHLGHFEKCQACLHVTMEVTSNLEVILKVIFV